MCLPSVQGCEERRSWTSWSSLHSLLQKLCVSFKALFCFLICLSQQQHQEYKAVLAVTAITCHHLTCQILKLHILLQLKFHFQRTMQLDTELPSLPALWSHGKPLFPVVRFSDQVSQWWEQMCLNSLSSSGLLGPPEESKGLLPHVNEGCYPCCFHCWFQCWSWLSRIPGLGRRMSTKSRNGWKSKAVK